MHESPAQLIGRAADNFRSHGHHLERQAEAVAFIDARLRDFRDGEGVITRRDAARLRILLESVAGCLRVNGQQLRGWADELEGTSRPSSPPAGGSVLRAVGRTS